MLIFLTSIFLRNPETEPQNLTTSSICPVFQYYSFFLLILFKKKVTVCSLKTHVTVLPPHPWWVFNDSINPNFVNSLRFFRFHKCLNITWKEVETIGRRWCDCHWSPGWQKAKVPPPPLEQSQTQKAAAQRVRKWALLNHVIVAWQSCILSRFLGKNNICSLVNPLTLKWCCNIYVMTLLLLLFPSVLHW